MPLWPEFLSYVLSFIIGGVFWVGHHNLFHYVRRTDRVFLWLNLAFLMFIAFIPLSTGCWAGTATSRSRWSSMECTYAVHRHRLVDPQIDANFVRMVKVRILLSPAACVVAIGASFVNVRWSILLYLLVLAFYILPGRIDRLWLGR